MYRMESTEGQAIAHLKRAQEDINCACLCMLVNYLRDVNISPFLLFIYSLNPFPLQLFM